MSLKYRSGPRDTAKRELSPLNVRGNHDEECRKIKVE